MEPMTRVSFEMHGLSKDEERYMMMGSMDGDGRNFVVQVEKCDNFTVLEAIQYLNKKASELAHCTIYNFTTMSSTPEKLEKSVLKTTIRGESEIGNNSVEVKEVLKRLNLLR